MDSSASESVSTFAAPWWSRNCSAHVPGVLVAGTFHQDGQRVFWDVHDSAKAVVIELDDDTYQRLVIEVPDPRATVEHIERAVAQR